MCSRPAWPLRIITRRTPLRTKSARTSRTKALSASTETLTVPGYGRVVVQTPYGIGGAADARGGRAAPSAPRGGWITTRSEEHTAELPSPFKLVFRLLLVKKKKN